MGCIYGGEQGLNAGELLVYGYLSIFGACSQQPILIQTRSNTPTRILPVEGWTVEDLQLYNRQLGDGRFQGVFKIPYSRLISRGANFRVFRESGPIRENFFSLSPDDPTTVMVESQLVLSFP